jgi:hypothetical protein
MAIDYTNIDSVIQGFDKVLNLSSIGGPPAIPTPLILVGVPRRVGLSPTKIASKIIARKSEAGLPVGALPSGSVNPDEIMERIRIEEIINALQQDAVITVGLPPGMTVQASGIGPSGPVTVVGSSILPFKGYGVIQ